jgi:hypothetical protein
MVFESPVADWVGYDKLQPVEKTINCRISWALGFIASSTVNLIAKTSSARRLAISQWWGILL